MTLQETFIGFTSDVKIKPWWTCKDDVGLDVSVSQYHYRQWKPKTMKPAPEEHALLFVGSHVASSTWWWQDAPERRQQRDKLHWERSQQLILNRFFHIWKTQADTLSMCVHEQHTPGIQQDDITTAVAYCPLRGRGGKMRANRVTSQTGSGRAEEEVIPPDVLVRLLRLWPAVKVTSLC